MTSVASNSLNKSVDLQKLAINLVRTVGSKAALTCCRENQWHGLYEVIEALERGTHGRTNG